MAKFSVTVHERVDEVETLSGGGRPLECGGSCMMFAPADHVPGRYELVAHQDAESSLLGSQPPALATRRRDR